MRPEIVFINDANEAPKDAVSVVADIAECLMPLEDLMDIEKEIERLEKEKNQLEGEIKRSSGKLNNIGFTDKAPAQVVDEERKKLEKYQALFEKVNERLIALKER